MEQESVNEGMVKKMKRETWVLGESGKSYKKIRFQVQEERDIYILVHRKVGGAVSRGTVNRGAVNRGVVVKA